jgi:Holliday junction resolvasome RuvABC ATP-dependent DNA helicase subunit
LCIKVRDYCIEKWIKNLTSSELSEFFQHAQIHDWGLTPLHERYLEVLAQYDRPIWVKVIAAQLWVNEKAVEEDIEPLLLKLWKIEKTSQWRVLS